MNRFLFLSLIFLTVQSFAAEDSFISLSKESVIIEKNDFGLLRYFDLQKRPLSGDFRINLINGYIQSSFNNGLFDGEFKQVVNNKLKFQIEYCGGKACGRYQSFYPNGKLAKHKEYNKWNQLDGDVKVYSQTDGRILRKSQYKQGVQDGVEVIYFASGLEGVKSRSQYVNGHKQGVETLYFQEGGLEIRQHYEQGKLHGLHTKYRDSGEKMFEANYAQGQYHGTARMYIEGRLWILKHYQSGKLHGKWIEYDLEQSGLTKQVKYFDKDKEIEQTGWSKK